jgi:hypothetical protein
VTFTDRQLLPWQCRIMRIAQILVAAVILGLAAGYAWSAMAPARAHLHVPRAGSAPTIVIPESEADRAWAARAEGDDEEELAAPARREDDERAEGKVRYGNCAEVRAAGKAPLHPGEPGYRQGLDSDSDGIACEPDPS